MRSPRILRKYCKIYRLVSRSSHTCAQLSQCLREPRIRNVSVESESAEAVTLVLKCIAKYIDLTTFKVGFYQYNSKKWFDLSYKKICEHTGLSLSRVRRALAELQRVGLLAVHPISEAVLASSGELRYYAKPAIKTINLALFALFGLTDRVQKERQKAYKRQKRKEEQSRTEEAENTVKTLLSGSEGRFRCRDGKSGTSSCKICRSESSTIEKTTSKCPKRGRYPLLKSDLLHIFRNFFS